MATRQPDGSGPRPPNKETSRVVLIGNSAYDAVGQPNLPGALASARRLNRILTDSEFGTFEADSVVRITNPRSRTEIGRAIEDAVDEAEDVLLIYYVGHAAITSNASDLRLVNGATPELEHQSHTVSEIRELIRPSRAKRKILMLDCCYAGQADNKGPIGAVGAQVDDGWAVVMAAGPMKSAKDSDGKGYTAFTGALIEQIEAGIDTNESGQVPEYLSLGAVFDYAQSHASAQYPRWTGNRGFDVGIARNPRWLRSDGAQLQQQWELAAIEALRACQSDDTTMYRTVPAIVRLLASEYSAFSIRSTDPWRSPGLALQMSQYVTAMLGGTEPSDLTREDCLALSVMPFVHSVWWDRALETDELANPSDPVSYKRFTAIHEHVRDRIEMAERIGRSQNAETLRRWLTRSWTIDETLRNKRSALMQEMIDDLENVMPTDARIPGLGDLLEDCLRMLLDSADSWVRTRPSRRRVTASRRTRIVLTLAQRMALDPLKMSQMLDHVRDGSLDPAELHDLDWSWEPVSRPRRGQADVLDLDAQPKSPEMLSVLRTHARELDEFVLREAASRDADLPTAVLSTRFTATGVVPARDEANQPLFSAAEMRFTLDEPRIRELLMGAQIYSHAGIAFRELYQNALDACRRRDRRSAFRNIKDGTHLPFSGKISFRHGDDNGRQYVECEDNGVGMGEQELATLFARGGARYTQSSEYLEEQTDWDSVGLTLHPNSAFGIGVFSYFMVADEIRITTHRHPRGHEREPALAVDVSGPGSLFRIVPTVRGDFGTTIRLYLKDGVPADGFVKVLKSWVWTSDYELHVSGPNDVGSFALLPGLLSNVAPVGAQDQSFQFSRWGFSGLESSFATKDQDDGPPPQPRAANLRTVAAGDPPDSWWCNTVGASLRDGLWLSHPIFGAVVNLSGEKMPALTVDRKRPLDIAATKEIAEEQLIDRIDALLGAGDKILSNGWLGRFATESSTKVSERIFDAALARGGVRWTLFGTEVDLRITGCFIPESEDEDAYTFSRWGRRGLGRALNAVGSFGSRVAEWRALAWAKAGLISGITVETEVDVATARPADALILGRSPGRFNRTASEYPDRPTEFDVQWAVEQTGLPLEIVRERLDTLGFDVSGLNFDMNLTKRDLELCSLISDDRGPWLNPDVAVPVGQIVSASRRLGISREEACIRLADLGFSTEAIPDGSDEELLALNEQSSGRIERWRRPGSAVVWGEIISMADSLQRNPAEIAIQLERLGFVVPTVPLSETIEAGIELTSVDLDGTAPWLDPGEIVPVGHILSAARRLRVSCAEVFTRLDALGFTLPSHAADLVPERWDDYLVRSWRENGVSRMPSTEEDLGIGYLAGAAETSGMSLSQVGSRLAQLGFRVSPELSGIRIHDLIDLEMLSAVDYRARGLVPGTELTGNQFLSMLARTDLRAKEAATRIADMGFRTPREMRFH